MWDRAGLVKNISPKQLYRLEGGVCWLSRAKPSGCALTLLRRFKFMLRFVSS